MRAGLEFFAKSLLIALALCGFLLWLDASAAHKWIGYNRSLVEPLLWLPSCIANEILLLDVLPRRTVIYIGMFVGFLQLWVMVLLAMAANKWRTRMLRPEAQPN